MSKLKELEDYVKTAGGQAKKVGELAAAAIREEAAHRSGVGVKSAGFVNGKRVLADG